jgi:hypothetical protein
MPAALAVVAGLGIYGYVTIHRFYRALEEVGPAGALLGIRSGGRVPSQGSILRSLRLPPDPPYTPVPEVPIPLYPGALVQGVTMGASAMEQGDTVISVLLGTDDSEEDVLNYYATAWAGLPVVRLKPGPSILYMQVVPAITEQSLVVKSGSLEMPSVSVQRGPAIEPMGTSRYARCLHGKERMPLDPSGKAMTEIWLMLNVR